MFCCSQFEFGYKNVTHQENNSSPSHRRALSQIWWRLATRTEVQIPGKPPVTSALHHQPSQTASAHSSTISAGDLVPFSYSSFHRLWCRCNEPQVQMRRHLQQREPRDRIWMAVHEACSPSWYGIQNNTTTNWKLKSLSQTRTQMPLWTQSRGGVLQYLGNVCMLQNSLFQCLPHRIWLKSMSGICHSRKMVLL